jgi:hypothetical protein
MIRCWTRITPRISSWCGAQYSGNAHGLIKGIGMVNCLYVNPDSGQYWIADYRLFDPEGDGKSKLDHVRDMLISLVASKAAIFDRVLVDSRYATKDLMLFIESLGQIYYCPLKDNRQLDDSGGQHEYCRAGALAWIPHELEHGKVVKRFDAGHTRCVCPALED